MWLEQQAAAINTSGATIRDAAKQLVAVAKYLLDGLLILNLMPEGEPHPLVAGVCQADH